MKKKSKARNLLAPAEATDRVNLSIYTIYRYICLGYLKARRLSSGNIRLGKKAVESAVR